MTKKDNNEGQNLVQQHAFSRLKEVEKEQRRAYKKEKNNNGRFQQIIMIVILLIILGTMIFSILV